MIEAVSTLSVQSAALRSQPQASVSSRVTEPVSKSNEYFISSRIRMDNLLDLAILEFRSGDNGDVIRQYPSESQIRAFQRAAELQTDKVGSEREAQLEAPVDNYSSADVSTPTPAPAPTTPAPEAASTPAPSTDGGSTVQSVIV